MALILLYAGSVRAAEIVAMRAYEHKEFHRLTIIVSDDITLTADKEDERVVLRMRGLTVKPLKDLPGTDAIKVRTFRQESDLNGDYASPEVSIPPGTKVTQTIKAGPFRVILDVYPPAGFGLKKEQDPYMKAVLLQQDAAKVLAFNDSWRWVYRKKVIDALRGAMYSDGSAEAFSASFGAGSVASGVISRLKAEGRASDAEVLGAIMDFQSTDADPDSERGLVLYANAGHPYPILLHAASSDVERLPATGHLIGPFPTEKYRSDFTLLKKGDVLLLYTDGIVEAQNEHQALYEEQRLIEALRTHRGRTPKEICHLILEEVQLFSRAATYGDDKTLVVIKRSR